MTTTCVVQARMGSTRLPGKVLADLGGRSLLTFLLERLASVPVDHLVVATGDGSADDTVADVAASAGASVVRGPESDVLARFALALDRYPADDVIRLTADCPLTDPSLVTRVLEHHLAVGADYTSNTLVRTWPDGLDVEVIKTDALRAAAAEALDPVEREHVTPFVYRRPNRFRLAAVRGEDDLGSEHWTVDTTEDLAFVRDVVSKLSQAFDWSDVLGVAGRRSQPHPGMLSLRPVRWEDRGLLLEWRNDPDTIAASRNRRPVEPAEHEGWVRRSLDVPARRIWIGHIGGTAVGQVRIDVEEGVGEVSLAVAPEARGRGHGAHLLGLLKETLSADYQVHTLVAEVRSGNISSLRCFEKARFKRGAEVAGTVGFEWNR